MTKMRVTAAIAVMSLGLVACVPEDDAPEETPRASAAPTEDEPTPAESTPEPEPEPEPGPNTVLMHDGVLQAELPEGYVFDASEGRWTNGTWMYGCWAWIDASIPVEGTSAAQITSTWMNQWSDWGYYTAGDVWSYANVNGYEENDIWYSVFIYETAGGDYDFEIWEPRSFLIDGDVFIECSARVYSPTEHPGVGWDDDFTRLVETVTIVDRDALLTNTWGLERGDY